MGDKLVRVGFISISDPPLTDSVISNIREISENKNFWLNITGVLYINLQTFEGPKRSIDLLMKSIKKDSRHTNVTLIQEKEIEERLYPNDNVKIIRILDSNTDSDTKMISYILDMKDKYI